jgi:hypothetical protein
MALGISEPGATTTSGPRRRPGSRAWPSLGESVDGDTRPRPSQMTGWPPGLGVVELPDGRTVRGRGLRSGLAVEEEPDIGFYLLAKEPVAMPWPQQWIRWPDFRRPADEALAFAALVDAFDRCASERVEIACHGGRGRTGCAIAVLGMLGGIAPGEAVAWVRGVYDPRAVDTPWQRRWLGRLDAGRIRATR